MDPVETNLYYSIVLTVFTLFLFLVVFFKASIILQQRFVKMHGDRLRAEVVSMERERKRVARDLHDETRGIIYDLRTKAEKVVANDAVSLALLEDIQKEIGAIDVSIHEISNGLMPIPIQHHGLSYALQELVIRREGEAGIHFNYEVNFLPRLDDETAMHIYRIGQEIINNVIKHSKANNLWISLEPIGDQIIFTLKDDGIGFDAVKVHRNMSGFGMDTIYNRVGLLKGDIYLNSQKGCEWIICIPLKPGGKNL